MPNPVQEGAGAEPVGGALWANTQPPQEGVVLGRRALTRPRGIENNSGQACTPFVSGERIKGKPKVGKFPMDGLESDKSYVWITETTNRKVSVCGSYCIVFTCLYGNYTNIFVAEYLVRLPHPQGDHMDQTRLNKYIQALTDKNVKAPCPRCGNQKFEIVGETFFPLQNDPNTISIGGPSVPAVIVACSRCGFLTFHAQGPLGMMPGVTNG